MVLVFKRWFAAPAPAVVTTPVFSSFSQPLVKTTVSPSLQPTPNFLGDSGPASTPNRLVFSLFSQPPAKGGNLPAHLQPPVNYQIGYFGPANTPRPLVFSTFSQPPPAATVGKIAAHLQPQVNFEVGFLGPAKTPDWFVFTDFSKPLFQKVAQQGNDVKYGIIRGPNFITMPSDQGSYVLSGKDSALTSARFLTAAQGTYLVNGQSITLNRGINMAAGKGTYTLNGITINTSAARTMNTTTGTYTISGKAVSLTLGHTLIAGPGTYVLSGQAVTNPRNTTLSGNTGAYILSGTPITLLYVSSTAPPETHFLPFLVTVGPLSSR